MHPHKNTDSEKKMTHYNIPVFIPHLGCPHDCVFCNQKKITGIKLTDKEADKIISNAKKTIDETLFEIEKTGSKKDRFVEIAFFGGSFTAIEKDVFTKLCLMAKEYVESGRVNGVRCSTRPDCIDDETLKFMKDCRFIMIELGVQSTDDFVLLKSGRGHTKKDVFDAAKKIKKAKIGLGLQMMTHLPYDTDEKAIKTAKDIISLKPDCVRIYPTLVIKGTRLFDMYESGTYKPARVEDAVNLCAKIMKMFYDANINIVRVGLQTTDEINENTVIGPYHGAFREICESIIYKDLIEKYVKKHKISNCTLKIRINGREISKAVGVKKSNTNYFKEKYGVVIKFKSDNRLKKRNLIFVN